MLLNCGAGKTLESPLNREEIKPVNPKGNQPWIFIRRTGAEAEAPILWPPDVKSQLIGKDSDAGKNWKQKEKRVAEDEMVGWCYRLNGQEFDQTLGVGDRQGSLACCSPWDHKESDTTKWLNWTELTREGVRILEVTAAFAWQSNKATLSFSSLTLVSVFLFGISVQRAKILAILLTISGWIWILGTFNQMPYIKFKNM